MKIFFDQLQHDIKYGRRSESVNLLSQSRHLAEKAPEDRPKLNDTGWGGTGMFSKLSIRFQLLIALVVRAAFVCSFLLCKVQLRFGTSDSGTLYFDPNLQNVIGHMEVSGNVSKFALTLLLRTHSKPGNAEGVKFPMPRSQSLGTGFK